MFLYWYESRLLAIQERALPRRARVHISLLALATVAIVCWGFLLDRYDLLYETVNLPVFFGPGYVEMKIVMPMIWLSVFSGGHRHIAGGQPQPQAGVEDTADCGCAVGA